jgi:methyl-accepting chemotaxis protein
MTMNIWQNMSLKRKIALLPALAIIVLLFLEVNSSRGFSGLKNHIDGVVHSYNERQDIAVLLKDLASVNGETHQLIVWTSSNYPDNKKKALEASIRSILKGMRQKITNGSTYTTLSEPYAHYEEWILKTIDMIVIDAAAASMFAGSVDESFQRINSDMRKMDEAANESSVKNYKSAMTNQKLTLRQSQLIGLTSMILFVILAFFIIQNIIKGIHKATEVALDLAEGEGDLTRRMNIASKDEIGLLSRSIDKLLSTLGGMIGQIKHSGEMLNLSGLELAALSEQMSNSTSNIKTRADGVATAAENMSENMNSVAAAVEEAAINITTVADSTGAIANAGKTISDNTKNARAMTSEAVSRTQSSYELINALADAAKAIGHVTETITEISEQTNLLALNATIEAARAGDAGKGFAVVAGEIKELAKQTANATVEINDKIKGIQTSTGKTVTEIKEILRVINEVDNIVDSISSAVANQTSATHDIAINIDQASKGIHEVASNVSRISTVSSDVAQDISEVSESSKELAISSDRVRQSAINLNAMTAKVLAVSDRFKV